MEEANSNKTTFILVLCTIGVLLIPLLVVGMIKVYQKNTQEYLLDIDYEINNNEASLNYKTEKPVVAMYIKNYGSVVMELYPDIAPNTVNNFISLVKQGFYDNNTFHRLDKDSVFVLQGGDPTGTGTGGPGYAIKGEFTNNGFENNLSHKKKVVSMARSQENDSAGSQFFIMLKDNTTLDGSYAAFGKVIDGWSNIERIADNESIADVSSGKLSTNLTIVKAIVDTKSKDYAEPEKITS